MQFKERRTRGTSVLAAALLALACGTEQPADSYGNFEAEEVVVSAETSGQLVSFSPTEGDQVARGATVALLDTVPLSLERAQLTAQRAGLVDRTSELVAQRRGLQVQQEIAARTRARIDALFAQQAATAQQRDAAERDDRVVASQITGMNASIARSEADKRVLDTRIAAANDRVQRTTVVSPIAGTVLTTYVRAGELVQPGQPLYRVANLDTLTLRAYVTANQLASIRLGQQVVVHIDSVAGALSNRTGIVRWISASAEFTPTPIQTRDARGVLVYAIKVRVPNPDGLLRIGMPADLSLPESATTPVP